MISYILSENGVVGKLGLISFTPQRRTMALQFTGYLMLLHLRTSLAVPEACVIVSATVNVRPFKDEDQPFVNDEAEIFSLKVCILADGIYAPDLVCSPHSEWLYRA